VQSNIVSHNFVTYVVIYFLLRFVKVKQKFPVFMYAELGPSTGFFCAFCEIFSAVIIYNGFTYN